MDKNKCPGHPPGNKNEVADILVDKDGNFIEKICHLGGKLIYKYKRRKK